MKTLAERMEFALDFARRDLSTLRTGDWLNLREDCLAFLGVFPTVVTQRPLGGMFTMPDKASWPHEWTDEDFQALQGDTRHILDGWVGPPHPGEPWTASPYDLRARYTVMPRTPIRRKTKHPKSSWESFLIVSGDGKALFRLTLLHLLAQASTGAVRRCPECQAIFYRVGKQIFCTRPCSNRANVRTWRQREEVRQAESERAHLRYAAKQKSQVGQGVLVQRKPRKGEHHVEAR
jgi:hypothetical protein